MQTKSMVPVGKSARLRSGGIGHISALSRRKNALWGCRILSAEVDGRTFKVGSC